MSYYYSYYVGYKKDGKIYPLGPYNCRGQLWNLFSRSRSFASKLYEEFHEVTEDMISDELRKAFEYTDWNGNKVCRVKFLPKDDLPKGSYIKSGYFLIKDVQEYEETNDSEGLFFDHISPEIYAAKLDHEMKFGKNPPQKDAEGFEHQEPSASDYMFYAYPDWDSAEYEADFIREFAYHFVDNETMLDSDEIVILETEG